MTCWPWILPHKRQGQHLAAFPNLQRWYEALKARPALRRGYDVGRELRRLSKDGPDDAARGALFGQHGNQ
jgi:GSH-dependent disulfide-bond oxidoreductase